MIAAIENAMIAALEAASTAGTLGYAWRWTDSYPDDFDAYLKDKKGQLRTPAAWAVFLGLGEGGDAGDDVGPKFTARFALIVASKSLRNETESRHGGAVAAEPGSYQLAIDAIRVLSRSDLGLPLTEPMTVTGARLVARSAELRSQGLSLMAIECRCGVGLGQFEDLDQLADFRTLHTDWDVPPIGNVQPPLPAEAPDAEDLVEIQQ